MAGWLDWMKGEGMLQELVTRALNRQLLDPIAE